MLPSTDKPSVLSSDEPASLRMRSSTSSRCGQLGGASQRRVISALATFAVATTDAATSRPSRTLPDSQRPNAERATDPTFSEGVRTSRRTATTFTYTRLTAPTSTEYQRFAANCLRFASDCG